jgi:hypothetical protein
VHVLVAEQRDRVHDERGDRRQRQRLVGSAQVEAPAAQQLGAHQQTQRDRERREDQRGEARRPACDPEEVLCHDRSIAGLR